MSDKAVILSNIQKFYGKHEVLHNVDLEINKGDIYGIVGKNGAGKTTIFKIILGLSEYQGGTMNIGGKDEDLLEGRKKIGFFIGSNFFPYMNAKQNLNYYAQLKGIKEKDEVDRVLKIVELDGVKSNFKSFSMGMRQRLGIANALLGNPEILILDEPTNGLDPQGIVDVRCLIKSLNEDYGITIIVSSHILGELQHTAHRFAILNQGQVVKVVSQEDLLSTEKTVRLSVDDLEKAKQVLTEAGVSILNEVQETRSLEDFYFDLVGGTKNV